MLPLSTPLVNNTGVSKSQILWRFVKPEAWAQFSWLWEYKRKLRKILKKEREKEKKEGFPNLLVP